MQSLIKTKALQQQTLAYIDFLQNELFYEAHEALEEIWFDLRFETCNDVRLVRAYINAAVSFELVKRGREKSGLKPWGFFQKNLHHFDEAPAHHQDFYQMIHHKILATQEKLNCFQT